jgi:predicted polyphosphate/ATP-dependent NAD kinase
MDRGAQPVAAARAARALARLDAGIPVHVIAAPGPMGSDLAARGFETETTALVSDAPTTAQDTRAAAIEIRRRGVDLLLFAGGDGTARDIHDAIGETMTVLGIPTGVKMHSGVFAENPEAAGEVAAAFLRRDPAVARVRSAEVADIDESAIREDRMATRLYGQLRVPADGRRVVGAKSSAAVDGMALDALARRIAREMEPGRLYVLGPGTTTARITEQLGLRGTLLGVDAVHDRKLVAVDAAEADLLDLVDRHPTTIIAGVVGGQGFVFGRGNQQLSAEVIRRVGTDNITIVADESKLYRLSPPRLRVDTGDPAVDELLTGYHRVQVGPFRTTVLKIST